MMRRLMRDPVTLATLVVWLAIASFHVIPGVPVEVLMRLGDKYSTLPLWPWAIAAALFGLARTSSASERRLWGWQAASFLHLLAIEAARGTARDTSAVVWDIAAECLYMGYYACQGLSVAEALGAVSLRTRRVARQLAVGATVGAALLLSLMAIGAADLYDGVVPSYVVYFTFDVSLAWLWMRARAAHPNGWRGALAGLALASALFALTDIIDLLYYRQIFRFDTGTPFDLLWTVPAVCYIVSIRLARLDETTRRDA